MNSLPKCACSALAVGLLALVMGLPFPALAQFRPRPAPTPKGPWMDRTLSSDRRADLVLEQMTLDEKISLVHGTGFGFRRPPDPEAAALLARSNGGAGFVPGIPRLGLPDLNMADSAVGVTRGAQRSRYSTALPFTLALAASWDPDLAQEYGALIGRELRDQGYNVSLGGGGDITREPRNGRNFEYQGEDPILAVRMAGRLMRGMQAQHIIGDIKHYAVNDQETGRNVASANLNRRALRETDLLAFEIAVQEAEPGGRSFFGGVVYDPSSPLKAIRAYAPRAHVEYNPGTDPATAAELARSVEVPIVFVTQPMSEGRDAPTLALPDHQDALVAAVAAANPRTIVVLETGGPISMPWSEQAGAVLEAWYPGIGGADAIANILFGDVNPSAKLPVTFARFDADLPHPMLPGSDIKPEMRSFPGAPPNAPRFPVLPPFDIDYTEGLKVGYKWFDAEGKTPLFAFGYGLSYTTFAYSGLKVEPGRVTFTVKNTGRRAGAEIAQVYAGLPSGANEPPKRLIAWQKITLAPSAAQTVTLPLEPKFLSIFNVERNDWELLPGEYKTFVGSSSRVTPLVGVLSLPGGSPR